MGVDSDGEEEGAKEEDEEEVVMVDQSNTVRGATGYLLITSMMRD